MTCLREMHLDDLFKFNTLVFDPFTEVYRLSFFLRHLAQWPDLAVAALSPDGQLEGFIFGVASLLMNHFGHMLDLRSAWYVDLYCRCSNQAAYKLYCALGYCLRRVLLEYYPGDPEEDAYDMRKPLSIDVERLTLALASRQSVRLPPDEDSDDDYY
ncbi:N-alpha-acetyltransferase 20 [Drosophila montana]|uniref:N-alpha-acetyltransferase 20 n=1 Tax=Drosophila montana TaxID=40370 RepID=UPI00313C658C